MSKESDVPVEVVLAAFNDEDGAEKALGQLKQAKKDRLIGIRNAAVLWKDDKGKLHFKETADMRGGKGAVIGGVIGGVVGLVFPPSILASAAVGAAHDWEGWRHANETLGAIQLLGHRALRPHPGRAGRDRCRARTGATSWRARRGSLLQAS